MNHFSIATGTMLLAALAACSEADTDANDIQVAGFSLQPGAVGMDAAQAAAGLWQEITVTNNYKNWALYPGTTEGQAGGAPHGAFVTLRYSGGDVTNPADGLIVVKENFAMDGTTLGAVTVMTKRTGFDPANADWFYAKYLPDGALDKTGMGMPLAGAVEPAPGMACRGCHRNADGGDFLFK